MGLKADAEETAIRNRDLVMNQELVERWELDNLLVSAMLIAQAALHRRESRGGHFREDHPGRSADFDYHSMVYMGPFGEVQIDRKPVDMSLYREGGTHAEMFGMIERSY